MSKSDETKVKAGKKRTIDMTNVKSVSNKIVKAVAKNDGQREALRAIDENKITIINGIAGTGKTYLAVSYGLQQLYRDKFKKIIFTRPVVEAGENLGFLPGSFDEKIAPYMIPINDIMGDHLSKTDIMDLMEEGKIVILPLAYMRGVTFRDAYVVLDEGQNATAKQLHMFLTRIGEGSKVVVTGDPSQSDIGRQSGLQDAIERLEGVSGLEIIHLDASCVVRDPIVAEIDERYAQTKEKR